MKKFFSIAAVAFFALMVSAAPVQSQSQTCAEREGIVRALTSTINVGGQNDAYPRTYGEVRIWVGPVGNGLIREFFANFETTTWTMLDTPVYGGLSCFAGSGVNVGSPDDVQKIIDAYAESGLAVSPNLDFSVDFGDPPQKEPEGDDI